jgi:hypothetical protein
VISLDDERPRFPAAGFFLKAIPKASDTKTMNIPSIGNVSGSSRLNGASVPSSAAPTDPLISQGTHYGKRLRAYADKVENRIQNALDSRDLTARQREAIETIDKKFQGLVKRMAHAFVSNNGSDPTAHNEIDRVVTSLNHVLGSGHSVTGSSTQSNEGLDTLA